MKKLTGTMMQSHFILIRFSLLVLLILSVSKSTVAQDYIHKQYGGPIYGKVQDILKKEVRYQKQSYFDSAIYVISRAAVIWIEYENGQKRIISENRWDKFYRPSVYSFLGFHNSGLVSSSGAESDAIGIGHKAVLKLPWNGFGLTYSVDLNIGNYYYRNSADHDDINLREFYCSGYINSGMEYRYSFFRGFGAFAELFLGFDQIRLSDQKLAYTSAASNYGGAIGLKIARFEGGVRYTRGLQKRTSGPADNVVPIFASDRFTLSYFQLYTAYCL
jgi:hypothetical protein